MELKKINHYLYIIIIIIKILSLYEIIIIIKLPSDDIKLLVIPLSKEISWIDIIELKKVNYYLI